MYKTVLVSVSILAYIASYLIYIRSVDSSFGLGGLLKGGISTPVLNMFLFMSCNSV